MNCFFIYEDITLGVQRQKDWETPGGISPLAECLFMGQRLGIGAAIVSHTLSTLSPVIRQNIETWIVPRLSAEDPHLVCNLLGTTAEQAEKLRTLHPGEFVCFNPVLWHKPVYATFSRPHIPGICTESMRRSTIEQFNKKVRAAPPAPLGTFRPHASGGHQSAPDKTGSRFPDLPARCLEFMVAAATGLPVPLTELYRRLGISGTEGWRIVKRLQDVGFIRIHNFSTGKRGGQLSLPEVTDPAWQFLIRKGLYRPKSRTNGDWEHEIADVLIEAEGKKQGQKVSFEPDLGGMRADVQWLDPKTGKRWIFNIGISRPAHEVDSIEKFLKLPAASDCKFTLVCRDAEFVRNVKAILKQRKREGAILRRIEIKLVADFVTI
jgi:DNA-binding Lrp family transcriptional regulator